MEGQAAVSIDHINIRTDHLEESCAFYERLLKLNRDAPPGMDPSQFAWLCNQDGRAIVHIASPAEAAGGSATGTGHLHHVAFTCSGYQDWRDRIDSMGLTCEINDFPAARLRQLFVTDPDGIRLEFNFYAVPEADFDSRNSTPSTSSGQN